MCFSPGEKDFENALKLSFIACTMPGIFLDATAEPARANRKALLIDTFRQLHERTRLQRSAAQFDLDPPTWVVATLDENACRVFPRAIALARVPRLQARDGGHAAQRLSSPAREGWRSRP